METVCSCGRCLAGELAAAYENCDYSGAMRVVMTLAERANKFVEDRAPWALKKDPQKASELQQVCTIALNLFRQLAIYLALVLPRLAQQTGELLNDPIVAWDQAQKPLLGTAVNKFQHMLQRVETKQVDAMIEVGKKSSPSGTEEGATTAEDGAAALAANL